MKNLFSVIIFTLFSVSAFAAEITVVGFELSPFQVRALESILEKELPGAQAELSVRRAVVANHEIVTIDVIVLNGDEMLQGKSVGFGSNLFEQSKEAILESK